MHTNHKFFSRFNLVLALSLFTQMAHAQSAEGGSGIFVIGILIVVGALILVSAVLTLSQNFLSIEATKNGIDIDGEDKAPSLSSLWKGAGPDYTNGANIISYSRASLQEHLSKRT